MEKQVALSYPTPIGRFRIPDAESTNRELRQIILDREAKYPSDNYANVGGWHSTADLLDWAGASVTTVKTSMLEAVGHMVGVSTEGKAPRGMVRLTAWANVTRRGHYHRVHNHPSSVWSGVYYVTDGGDSPNHPLSGVLELCDPRPFTEMVPAPGNPCGQRVIFRAEAGTMIVFPDWLYHFVNPFYGDGERISIAFNMQWQASPQG